MGASAPPPPPPPEAPDYGAVNRAGILTEAQTLPVKRKVDLAARLGKTGTYELDGQTYDYDFEGLGDIDYARAQRDYQSESADMQAQDLLALQQKYGTEFLETSRDQLKASDPIGFAIRENMGTQVRDQLAMGGAASDDELRAVQQRIRANQARIGNTMGVAAGVQEVMGQTQYQQQRQQQRMANAGSFLAGTTPLSQFGQLRSAQAGAAPYAPMQSNAIGFNQGAGQMGANFGLQRQAGMANVYSTQSGNWQTQMNQPNPWMQGLGMVAGLGTGYAMYRS